MNTMTALEDFRNDHPDAFLAEELGQGRWQLWGIHSGEYFEGEWFNATGDYEDPYGLGLHPADLY